MAHPIKIINKEHFSSTKSKRSDKNSILLLETELFYKRAVHALVVLLEVLEVLPAISDESEQAAARVFILVVFRQMCRKFLDAAGQYCYLDLRRARVLLVTSHF